MAGRSRFFGCYLLSSLEPKYKHHTYIGFTTNPRIRLRQHNGELKAGAKKTKQKRPWDMVLFVHGFPTKVDALQFEWAWQKPKISKKVRDEVRKLPNLRPVTFTIAKIRILGTMLRISPWDKFPLGVHIMTTVPEYISTFQDLDVPPPDHMKVTYGDMESFNFDKYKLVVGKADAIESEEDEAESVCDDDSSIGGYESQRFDSQANSASDSLSNRNSLFPQTCALCTRRLKRSGFVACSTCNAAAHPTCLAEHSFKDVPDPDKVLIPEHVFCPLCMSRFTWGSALAAGREAAYNMEKEMSPQVPVKRKKATKTTKKSVNEIMETMNPTRRNKSTLATVSETTADPQQPEDSDNDADGNSTLLEADEDIFLAVE